MNKLKTFLRCHRPSRRIHIVLNVLAAAFILFAAYVLSGSPAIGETMALRREESRRLIGPGEILAHVDTGCQYYPEIIVLDEGSGFALWTTSGRLTVSTSSEQRRLCYREKSGDLTLMPEPLSFSPSGSFDHICIFAFDNVPEAVTAKLQMTLSDDGYGYPAHDYKTTAQREYDNFFVFTLNLQYGEDYYSSEKAAFFDLAQTSKDTRLYINVPVTVQFYDASGELISEVNSAIMSRSAAYEQENG